MATVQVEKHTIDNMVKHVGEVLESLAKSQASFETMTPKGFTLFKIPDPANTIGELTEIAAGIAAEIKRAEIDEKFGKTQKSKRVLRRSKA